MVGTVTKTEVRDDGEWCWCEPAITTPEQRADWVRAEAVKPYVQPDYSRARRGRRR